MKKIFLTSPCKKCPYHLKQVQTLENPCPNCKANQYNMLEFFQKNKDFPKEHS